MKLLNKGIICLSLGTAFLAVSCANEAPWSSSDKADGKIYLNLTADGSVSEGTRAEGYSPLVPNPSEFKISLQSTDGSYKNSWNSLDAFNKEAGFPMGNYIVAASFGEDAQEGFSNPYFYGSSTVNVSIGESSDVTIIATLANSMVSIRYDDKLAEYYPEHSASIQTEGNNPVAYAQTETRPGYITPGNVKLNVTLTDENDHTVTVSPSTFVAEPRKHYIVTIGMEEGADRGYNTLTVDYSEEVVEESKDISLTDELFTAPEPKVELKGCNESEELVEGLVYEEVNPEFHIFAYGGLSKAVLNITADDEDNLPLCGSKVVIVGENPTDKSIVESSGIDCSGIYDKRSDMSVINIRDLVKSLQPGSYTFNLDLEDELGRTTTSNLTLKVTITGLDYEIISYETPEFLETEITVVVATNSDQSKDQFKFQSLKNGSLVDVKAELLPDYNVESVSTSLDYKYAYKLTVSEIEDLTWTIATYIPSRTVKEKQIEVNAPDFTLECDAFAKRVKIRPVVDTDERIKNLILTRGKLYNGTTLVQDLSSDQTNVEDGIITITGLDPNKDYNGVYSLSFGDKLIDRYKNNISFKTEEEVQIPNSDFKSTVNLKVDPIKVGGAYIVSGFGVGANSPLQITSSINRDVPAGNWATLNELTCYSSSINNCTWYKEPSTYIDNNQVIIRTVGYNHDGKELPKSGGEWNQTYYCEYSPNPEDLNSSYGELFLGRYSFDGNEHREDGIDFYTRPSSISFTYGYTSVNNEKGVVEIKILDKNNQIISKAYEELEPAINSEVKILLDPYEFGDTAVKIRVSFKSSNVLNNPHINIPTGSLLDEGFTRTTYLANRQKKANDYKAFAMGSELRISNVKLGYE